MGRKRRKRVAFRFYLLLIAALCIFGYGVYIAVDSLVQNTAVIESGGMDSQYSARAVIVRDEKVTDVEGLTSVKYYAEEGTLVYRGNRIADVYSSGYSTTDRNKLLSVRQNIKVQHKLLLASTYSDQTLERLDTQIYEYAREFELLVHNKAQGNLLNLETQLQTSLTARQNHLRNKYSNQQLIKYYEEEATLVKKIQSWTTTHLAQSDCIVSFYTDGYEEVLDIANFDDITAVQVRSILNGEAPEQSVVQRGRTSVFREVSPSGWYLLLISNDSNWNPVVGQSYKVQLTGFDDHVVDAAVSSFSRSGNELLVRMTVNGDVKPVLNVRTAEALVGELYVSGLKVPLNALHYQNGQWGVVLTDNGGVFVPVYEIMRDNNYAVIQPVAAGALQAGQKVKVF